MNIQTNGWMNVKRLWEMDWNMKMSKSDGQGNLIDEKVKNE